MENKNFSTAEFQSKPTVKNNFVEPNKKQYLENYGRGLMDFLECEFTNITKKQREFILLELNNVLRAIKK